MKEISIHCCNKCHQLKLREEFCANVAKYRLCKECARVRDNTRYANNKEEYAIRNRRARLKQEYGLTIEAYTAMLQVQFYKCAACGDKLDPEVKRHAICVDHDHVTGEVRQLICRHCNIALGYVKDDVDRLEKLIVYLRRHGK
jgi:hypothetical protein